MTRRFNALVMVLIMFVSVVIPSRNAMALAPIAAVYPLAVSFVNSAGAVLASEALTAAGTYMLGGMAMAAILLTPGDSSQTQLRIPVTGDAAATNVAMPPPSAPATAYPVEKYGFSASCNGTSFGFIASYSGACNMAGGVFIDYGNGGGYCSGIPAGCSVSNMTQSSPPPGYGNCTGSGCVLTEPRLVAPDNKTDVARTSSGFVPVTSANEADPMPAYASSSGGKVYASGKNSGGQPVMVEYAVSPDGTKTYVTHYTQTESGGQTVVNTQAITIDSATGQVVSSGSAAAQGSLSGVGTANPAVTTGAAVTPTTGTGSGEIVFPTDYARTGEMANAANSINSRADANTQTIKTSIEDLTKVENATLVDPAIPDSSEFTNSFFPDTFGGLLSWNLPAHSSECPMPDLSYTAFGYYNHLILDAHCTIYEQVKGTMSVVMVAVWSIVALFIVLGA